MLGQLRNNNRTSFGQLDENNDEDLSSAPPSIPSVPSFGTEDWRHFRHNTSMDGGTISASPISPSCSGFASNGSSGGIARSYSTTPLSSTSLEVPRSSWPLIFKASQQVQLAEIYSKSHTKFILEDPSVAKHKKDKAMRACTPCFTKRLECSESEIPNRCLQCIDKASYCKGPIETPQLLQMEWLEAMITAIIGLYHVSIESQPEPGLFGTMQVDLRLEPLSEHDSGSDNQIQRVQLPAMRADFRFIWESSNLDDVLDTILSADVPLCIPSKCGSYDLSTYEHLCRRLCACISLLRRPDASTIDRKYKNDHRVVPIVVGFLGQLAHTASSTFTEIFDHIRGCCFANRDRRGTPNLMFNLAKHLGQLHAEIQHFEDDKIQYPDLLPLTELLLNVPQILEQLDNLGRGLCPKAFDTDHVPMEIAGVHLTPCFEPCHNTSTERVCNLSQHVSFLDVLRDSARYQRPGDDRPAPMVDNDDTARSRQNVDVEDSNLLFENQIQDDIINSQDMICEDNVAFGVEGLQAEANAMLNPEWTVRLDDFAATQSTQPTINMDLLEPMLHDQYIDLGHQSTGVQHAGYAYLRSSGPHSGPRIGPSMLPSHQNVTVPSQPQSNAIQQFNAATDSSILDFTKFLHSVPIPTPEEVPKRANKRKRIRTSLSRKKPCLTPSYHTKNHDLGVLKNNLSSRLTLPTEAARAMTTNNSTSSKKPAEYATETSQFDSMRAWKQGSAGRNKFDNAGIVKDIVILDSERRPLSWPHRNPWRKSLDISVAVLTKGFEKLMTERGEAASSVV